MKKCEDFDIGWKSYAKRVVFYCCLFLCVQLIPTKGYSQEVRLTLKMDNVTLLSVFNEITKQTGYEFVYSSTILKKVGKVSVNVSNESLEKVLDLCLAKTDLGYKVEDKHVIISPKLKKEDPKKTITYSGEVKDKAGNTLPGVTIILEGTSAGVVTDANGKFSISVPEASETRLVFSFVGMKKKVVTVKDQKPLKIVMEEEVTAVDEVVVTGIFNKPKESFTGAAVKVTRDELKRAGNRNILKALSNIDPSFQIVENNAYGSDPNKLPEIRLRGVSTIPSVSDLQTDMRAELCTPLFILDGFEITLERMMDLNNDEIESITILKDASATAIYGSRGANGVVVIKSVQPEQGKLKISYNGNLNLEIPSLSSYNLLNAAEKLQLEWDAGLYENDVTTEDLKLKRSYAKKLERVQAGVDTDWKSIPVQVGVGQNHYLGINGGDAVFRYSMGLSYNNVVGAMKGSLRNTLNGSVNLSYLGEKFQLSNSMSFNINNSSESPYGAFSEYVKMNPYWEPYDENGEVVMQFEKESTALFSNPVTSPMWNAMSGSFSKSKYSGITNNLSVTYKPIKSLQITANVSFNKTYSSSDNYQSSKHANQIWKEDVLERGQRDYVSNENSSWSTGGTVNYYKQWDKHILSVGFNMEFRESSAVSRSISVMGFLNDEMNSLGNGYEYYGERPTSSDSKSRAVGFTGTVNYNYNNRYFFDVSYRMDGASSFGSDSRFAPFWSLGAGWTVSNEEWMKEHLSFINYLRVKYSFGCAGSLAFSPWQSQGTYTFNQQIYQGGVVAIISGLENPDLKWQNTYQHNVGIDLGFWGSKISITANYYRKLTDNSITDMALPLSNGFESYTGNSGEILNTGFDLSVSFYMLRNEDREIYWNMTFGTSYNKNKLLKLSEAVKEQMNELRSNQSKGLYYVYEEGNSVDAIYAVPTVGVDPSTGQLIYLYKDGTQSYKYDVSQRVVCGDRMPKLDGRLSTSFRWKGFSVSTGFTIRTGGQQYNETYANKIENVNLEYNVDRRVSTERWMYPGDEATFTGLDYKNYYITDRYIQDEKTFECNNINVTYDFRQKWVQQVGLSRLSVTASIGNVFRWSTIKQERGTSYPFAIQPTFGISCSF